MPEHNYIISNIDRFTDSTRRLVFSQFGEDKSISQDETDIFKFNFTLEEEKELDTVLSMQESKSIVISLCKKKKHKTKSITRYMINDKIFMAILEALNTRLVSNILLSLTQKGLIESAYDSKLDDFVFWVKNNENSES